MCSKSCKTDVLEIYSNGYKTDILDNSVSLAILFCMLVISLQLTPIIFFYCKYTVEYIKRYTKLERTKNLKFPRLASIKIGYYYANKVNNHYFANLIYKIIKKHLNIKEITPGMVLSDLYSSTSFGPLYHYRNIRGFINRSILFSQIKRIT